MAKGALVNRGFWLILGLVAGLLVSDLATVKTAEAVATCQYKEYMIATGASNQATIEFCWLLDYKGARLLCIALNQAGALGGITEVDLLEEFKLGAAGEAPHFMMVTGKFQTREIADILYVAETTTGQIMVVAIPPRMLQNGAPAGPPRVISKFSFTERQSQ